MTSRMTTRPRTFILGMLAALSVSAVGRCEEPKCSNGTIAGLSFIGNEFLSDAVLGANISSSPFTAGECNGNYDAGVIVADIVKIEEIYRSFGFFDARVTCTHFWWTDKSHKVNLVFRIEEGRRHVEQNTMPVTNPNFVPLACLEAVIKVSGHSGVRKAQVEIHVIDTPEGSPLTYTTYDSDEPANDTTGVIPAKYMVEEPSPTRVGQVFIRGNEKTAFDVILDAVGLYPGQVLETAELQKAEERLVRLNRFVVDAEKGVRPTVAVIDDPKDPKSVYKDILISVKEKPPTDAAQVFSFWIGFSR